MASRFDPTKYLREKSETINHEFSSKGKSIFSSYHTIYTIKIFTTKCMYGRYQTARNGAELKSDNTKVQPSAVKLRYI